MMYCTFITIGALTLASLVFSLLPNVSAINYSAGTYGTCTYDTCSISLSSSATVSVNITPTIGTTCSIASNSVTASTDASTGYTVTVNNADTSTALSGPSANTIPSIGSTPSSPATLTANTWGYRVDTVSGFGPGPTTALTNGAIPGNLFAGVPSSAAGGGAIRTTTSAEAGYATPVWYGVCVDSTKPSGTYSDGVVYTAVIN